MKPYRSYAVAVAMFCSELLVTVSAGAASLQMVSQGEWAVDGLPSYVNMYIYVPDNLATKPPIVVAPHHCQGSGQSSYNEMSSLVSIADKNGFIMIFPEATGQNCWDAGSTRSLKHDGGGDAHAIVQMVRYTLSKYNGDASRVYSVGASSGGIMTEALLGVYPDVFTAGVSYMGVPCGCWAESYNDVVGAGSSAQWSGPCASGNVTKTGQQWGDLVRSYFPEYTGHRPRLQHWHGTIDNILSYNNVAEDIKQWTNLLGLSENPSGTDTPSVGVTREFWSNSCGYTVYESFSLAGVGHSVPFDGNAVATYFGLDAVGGLDPEAEACPDVGTGGTGGSRDAGDAGGMSGSRDADDASGVWDAGDRNDGGPSAPDGSVSGSGAGTGGSFGPSITSGTAGDPSPSGSSGGAGAGGSFGTGAAGTVNGSGGTSANGGNSGQSGNFATSSTTSTGSSSTDCDCTLANHRRRSNTGSLTFLFAALGLLLRRSRRREIK